MIYDRLALLFRGNAFYDKLEVDIQVNRGIFDCRPAPSTDMPEGALVFLAHVGAFTIGSHDTLCFLAFFLASSLST
jgi:hypothetical protein